jgi:hypothetical protein
VPYVAIKEPQQILSPSSYQKRGMTRSRRVNTNIFLSKVSKVEIRVNDELLRCILKVFKWKKCLRVCRSPMRPIYNKGTYHVHIGSSCTRTNKVYKKIHTYSFHPTASVYEISRLNPL